MRNRNNLSGIIWGLVILGFILGSDGLLTLFIIAAIVIAITVAAVNSSKKNDQQTYSSRKNYQKTYGGTNSFSASKNKMSANELAEINIFLRGWFRDKRSLPIGTNIDLRIHGSQYTTLTSLDVYRDNTYICTLSEFRNRYPDSYGEIMKELSTLAKKYEAKNTADVFDAETVETKQEKKPEQPSQKQEAAKDAAYYINEINQLNDDIPDDDISNGLFETASLLKQIDMLEEKFPRAKNKLSKLYEYYLPILVRILKQYVNLQAAKTDPAYEETSKKLKRTISLINDAMKNIISSMTDEDFMNLSADISTLEAVLQKDGLTSDSNITMTNASKDGGIDE